jgi:hypothetical protein
MYDAEAGSSSASIVKNCHDRTILGASSVCASEMILISKFEAQSLPEAI